ncbi:LPS-assembly protein LptD [Rhodoferax sp.]|uniref:LPS-assembly protein LptD n=1 Tax=Rhodoferax sp. TaxID=50421 RepID=UPI0026336B2A|nr:LPS-assembly protein LptD [Rhodoferax sp.]MDD2810455.1 LPS-assembly protein LptD [Rhodoferax sp.]
MRRVKLPVVAQPVRTPAMLLKALLPLMVVNAHAQTPAEPALQLQASPQLQEAIDADVRRQLPTFVTGEHISGRPDLNTQVQGAAELRKGDMVIRADQLDYDQPTDLAKASGHVRINRAGNVYEGPLLELRLDAFEGFFNTPNYHFLRNDAHGQADRIEFLDAQRSIIHNASFTTCKRLPGPDWMPDWILRASQITMDNDEDVGTATGAMLSFKGVPVLPVPYVSFPLSDQRKSGVLPPTLGVDNVNGSEVSVPYYWNIAPNRDVTVTPTVMTKRGVNLDTEFRYLEPDYAGTLRTNWMPSDKLRNSNRWGLNLNHQARLQSPWTAGPALLALNLNRVSDDNYWRDFTRANASLTQRLLANDATLAWQNGAWASSLRTLKWQTLQDVTAPIIPPYDRLPQLTTRTSRNLWGGGLDVTLEADYTRFQSSRTLTLQPNADRVFSVLQASHTFQSPAGYIRPKIQLHATNYQFDAALKDGATQANRTVPSLSLDAGVVFERDTQLFGRALLQTLEPRAFYVNTPYRDQSLLPNYDSGAYDFNFATIYQENAFVGNDRISDSNLLTLGVTSRFLNLDTGAEVARVGLAQRLRFRDQNVTLPGVLPATDRLSDILLGGSLNWDTRWKLDGTVQINPTTDESVRATLAARYNPGRYRTLNMAYRFQRNSSEQIDLGWQWPLHSLMGGASLAAGADPVPGRWYSVGRLNYSMNERKLVDSVLGFEYDAGCWLGRIVLERLQTSSVTATQRLMFQLEFVGFSRLGVNPLKSLKSNIPNYQTLREPAASPSRFSNYD